MNCDDEDEEDACESATWRETVRISLLEGRLVRPMDQTVEGVMSPRIDFITKMAMMVCTTPRRAATMPMMMRSWEEELAGRKQLRIPPVHSNRSPKARQYMATFVRMLAATSRRKERSCCSCELLMLAQVASFLGSCLTSGTWIVGRGTDLMAGSVFPAFRLLLVTDSLRE